MDVLVKAEPKAWLEPFAPKQGVAAQWFHRAARAKGATEESVLTGGLGLALVSLRNADPERLDLVLTMVRHVHDDPEGARRFARSCLERAVETPEARKARKAREEQEGIKAHMEQQPPTQKQLDYLLSLGCTEIPANRLIAHDWIDQYVSQRPRR